MKCIYITKHFTILHVVQETGCKFQVETIKMGLTWSFTSKDKNFYNFSQIFFSQGFISIQFIMVLLCSVFSLHKE